jgi:two-component system, NarL family, response regulator LiaR
VAVAIQTISSHPLLTRAVQDILADLPVPLLPAATNEAAATDQLDSPRLFLLDACSLHTDLGPLAGRCRARSPGSRFLALLPPATSNFPEEIRLFFWGIEGFVELGETWQTELPLAILSILKGGLWVPPEVLAAYAIQAKSLLDAQLLPGHSLTAREGQVLQFLMRRLTNKEISNALAISERTTKFHVSNILGKLNLKDRHGLLPENFTMPALRPATPSDRLRQG